MAFDVSVAPAVIDYLRSRDYLTEWDRERLIDGVRDELSKTADAFLARSPHPFFPNAFEYTFGLMTESLVFREFEFACSAEGQIYGVIEVLYAEELPPNEDDES